MKKELTVNTSLKIKASSTAIWQALTDPEMTARYMFGAKVQSDWKLGSPITWLGEHEGQTIVIMKGKIEAIEAEKHLTYTTFWIQSGREDIPANYTGVSYDIESAGTDEYMLSISQGDFSTFEDAEARYQETLDLWQQVLKVLKEMVEA